MNDADITAVLGASGMGKSYLIAHKFLKPAPRRLLVWSHKQEDYKHLAPPIVAKEVRDLAEPFRRMKGAAWKINISPSWDQKTRKQQFDMFCLAALAAGNCTVIVEELHMVTSPNHAPGPWQQLSCVGRGYGIRLVGTSQRPAHMDKDFLSNCTRLICFRVNDEIDWRRMGKALGVPGATIRDLPKTHYLERATDHTSAQLRTPTGTRTKKKSA